MRKTPKGKRALLQDAAEPAKFGHEATTLSGAMPIKAGRATTKAAKPNPSPKSEPEREAAGQKAGASRLRVGTRAWVVERLVENVRRAMEAEEIKERGVATGKHRYDGSVANRALELIGKELGLFVERSDNRNVQYVISDRPLTQEEWKARYITKP